jgi:ribosomal protein S27E
MSNELNTKVENITCQQCGVLLAKITRGTTDRITLIKYSHGKPVYITIKVWYAAGGITEVICEKCNAETPVYTASTVMFLKTSSEIRGNEWIRKITIPD